MGKTFLTRVEIHDFRNHRRWESSFSPELTVLVGENATGKTNILEALAVAATGRSFRPFVWKDLVREGSRQARVIVEGIRDQTSFSLDLAVDAQGNREHSIDGRKESAAALSRRIPMVSFVPEDLMITKGTADERRAALDRIGETLSSAYATVRREYSRIVRQRNHLLRADGGRQVVEPWDIRMVEVGAALVIQRARLIARMEPEMGKAYKVIGGGEALETRFSLSWDTVSRSAEEILSLGRDGVAERIEAALGEVSDRERERKVTLVGPHRDDLLFVIEGRPAREFASQGQHRTLALSWKMAEVSAVNHVNGSRPILLLDDVMSELDGRRREALAGEVIGRTQTIVTTTNLDYFSSEMLDGALVTRMSEQAAP